MKSIPELDGSNEGATLVHETELRVWLLSVKLLRGRMFMWPIDFLLYLTIIRKVIYSYGSKFGISRGTHQSLGSTYVKQKKE